ncbi:Metallophosphoesterase 1 [Halocaridina rubra]|uniref:Metallophosphoesterase 1 n=1 Tax=Halocaridina rubra TaxID=373956 RepID=A0AAN8ZWK8_HALRR
MEVIFASQYQHYPLFRESDSICNEPDEAPRDLKYAKFRERWECISKDSSEMLFDELSPRLVLSGHTHHGCHVQHNISEGRTVHEYTVPSFSWRNKRNPTFLMATLSPNNYAIYKCHMPSEYTVMAMYFMSFVFLMLWLLNRKFRSQGLLYIKVSKHLD